MPDLVRFLGHFHPVILHLPIGVFALILVYELAAFVGRWRVADLEKSTFPLFFGAASAVVAVVAGFLLYQGEVQFKGSALVERHLWSGIAFAVAAIGTWICKEWTFACGINAIFYRLLLFGSVGVMGFASHQGASVTHGEEYLTEYAPAPIRQLLGHKEKPTAKSEAVIAPVKSSQDQQLYADVVAPILERRCVQCHKEGKSKGKFRMDSYELLLRGGKEGAGIVPGNALESNIFVRVTLPKSDEEHMPPEGKPGLEEHEIAIIKWWLDQGADRTKSVGESAVPENIRAAIALLPTTASAAASKSPENARSEVIDDGLRLQVTKISKAFPGAITFESQQSDKLAFTAASLRANFKDADLKTLEAVGNHLTALDLAGTQVSDLGVAQMASGKNLKMIRLSETRVTDACIDTLLAMPELESVNLYGTKVTDGGVLKLSGLSRLKRLYLWKTEVSDGAIQTLQKSLPGCEIIRGVSP
ncbi:MAG: hypothetical protein ORN51_13225 [Akkermansiaceae bacterium]|nr:hypothetical protein [Akkermansiaceae bacterium]